MNWTEPAREYLAFRDPAAMDEAIRAATDTETRALLQGFVDGAAAGDFSNLTTAFEARLERYSLAPDRPPTPDETVDFVTSQLLWLDPQAQLVEVFDGREPEEAFHLMETGIDTSAKAAGLSKHIGDVACEAYYTRSHAIGFGKTEMWNAAEQSYVRSTELYRSLRPASARQRHELAKTLASLGAVQLAMKDHTASLNSLTEAVTIFRELSASPQDGIDLELASSLATLGALYRDLAQVDDARTVLEEALAEHSHVDPLRKLLATPELARTLVLFGSLLGGRLGTLAEARAANATAVALLRQLADARPRPYRRYLAEACHAAARILWRLEEGTLAAAMSARAIELAGNEPQIYLRHLARYYLGNVPIAMGLQGDSEALQDCQHSVEIFRSLQGRDQRLYAHTLRNALVIEETLRTRLRSGKDRGRLFAEIAKHEAAERLVFSPAEIEQLVGGFDAAGQTHTDFNVVEFLRKRLPQLMGDGVLETPVTLARSQSGRTQTDAPRSPDAERPAHDAEDAPESRRQAQIDLIEAIVRSRRDTKDLLTKYAALIDVDFVALLKSRASLASSQHRPDQAELLNGIASILAESLDIGEQFLAPRTELLVGLLNAAVANDDGASFQQLLTSQVDLIDLRTVTMFQSWVQGALAEPTPERRQLLGRKMLGLSALASGLFLTRPFVRALALAACEGASTALLRDDDPFLWALAQYLVGSELMLRYANSSYSGASRGEDVEGVERCVAAFEAALEMFSRIGSPYDCANASHDLGRALLLRKGKDNEADLERSIELQHAALIGFDRERFPDKWASTHSDLAILFLNRKQGDSVLNLSQSVQHYNSALQVLSPESSPTEWAMTQLGLANAYVHNSYEHRQRDAEAAIAAATKAMGVLTRTHFPKQWSVAQHSLGTAYGLRGGQGDDARKIAAWRACAEASLEFDGPEERVKSWYNLGTAYGERKTGDLDEYREIAIACYQTAIAVPKDEASVWDWASCYLNLGGCYVDRTRGLRETNLASAIEAYKQASEAFSATTMPLDWAKAKLGLGRACGERIQGQRSRLDEAIEAYRAALSVVTYEADKETWARANLGLGAMYARRHSEEVSGQGQEEAIGVFNSTLEVVTRDALPREWATLHEHLGSVYAVRRAGDPLENGEKSLFHWHQAEKELTAATFPDDSVRLQGKLGIGYFDRIGGDPAVNIERAIAIFENLLKIATQDAYPNDFAAAQAELLMAFPLRQMGDREENLERAIAAGALACQVDTRESATYNWARAQMLLANAYHHRVRGDKTENLEIAISSYEIAIEALGRERDPMLWASIKHNLGLVYPDRLKGNPAENRELGLQAIREALEVPFKDLDPLKWALRQANLATSYEKRILGDPTENHHLSMEAFGRALEAVSPRLDPELCFRVGSGLGRVAARLGRWEEARRGLASAVAAAEVRREGVGHANRRREFMEEAIGVYADMVTACIKTKRPAEALLYAERSKARGLMDLLQERDTGYAKSIPSDLLESWRALRQRLIVSRPSDWLETTEARDSNKFGQSELLPESSGPKLHETLTAMERQRVLDQQRFETLLDEIGHTSPEFRMAQAVQPLDVEALRQFAANSRAVIVEWYTAHDALHAFVWGPDSTSPRTISYEPENVELLGRWLNEFFNSTEGYFRSRRMWEGRLRSRLADLAAILRIAEILRLPEVSGADVLVLVPHRALHLLPLHALPVGTGSVIDHFGGGVRYAPSIALGILTEHRAREHFERIVVIKNPTSDLRYADLEISDLRVQFPKSIEVLDATSANRDSVVYSSVAGPIHAAHFACHGYFNAAEPLRSALVLADGEVLTLGNIFDLTLEDCRMVVLSACETGMSELSPGDEFLGFPGGFLFAGARCVVSTLWRVSDLSTTILMMRFYELLCAKDKPALHSVARILRQAQLWLRTVTGRDLHEWLAQRADKLALTQTEEAILGELRQKTWNEDERPFEDPFHWAGFVCCGD